MDQPLLWLGVVACTLAAAAGLLPLARAARLAGLTTALLLAPVLVAADNWDSERLADLRDGPLLIVAGLFAAAAGLLVLALVFRRRPLLLAPALVAAMPFRIPVDLGGGDSNLLLPLYAVIGAGVLAALLERGGAPRAQAPAAEGWLRWTGTALAAVLVLYGLQAGYADDLSKAVENVSFFLVPFAALYFLLARVEWDRSTLRTIVIVLAVEGLVFAAVAAFQYASGELFWNDKVISGNEAHPYFRVNSLFWDPNILGRYLAVTMVALAAVVAFGRERREAIAASLVFVALLATLVVTFSQSSTIALIGGILVLAAARWGIAAGVAAGAASVLALAASLALIGGGGLSSESEGRSGLVDGGIEIGADAPVFGVGSGGFAEEFGARFGGDEGFALESHTEPITVFAEGGLVGLAAYGALLLVTAGGLLAATAPRLRRRAAGTPLAAALLAAYAVMIVHSLGYGAFLTDPITWALLAVAVGARLTAPPDPAAG